MPVTVCYSLRLCIGPICPKPNYLVSKHCQRSFYLNFILKSQFLVNYILRNWSIHMVHGLFKWFCLISNICALLQTYNILYLCIYERHKEAEVRQCLHGPSSQQRLSPGQHSVQKGSLTSCLLFVWIWMCVDVNLPYTVFCLSALCSLAYCNKVWHQWTWTELIVTVCIILLLCWKFYNQWKH